MTEPTRGVRARRGNRRPGSLLLTALLVLAIVASSALVFTNRVELLKLAVIVSLWAAVAAAFVSFIYRRQSDVDQAKTRDLKLVYDLQLDREISARREYELSIESQLRRELASELRAETSDEVAALRAELAALRANLEIIFDTDLQSRPAIENERTTVHTFGDWSGVGQGATAPEREDRSIGPGRVISSRIDTEEPEDFDFDPSTEESPIIDVPAVPQHPDEWEAQNFGGAHRRPSEPEPVDSGWRATRDEEPSRQEGGRRRAPEPDSAPPSETRLPWLPPETPPPPPPRQPPPPPPQRQEPVFARNVPTGPEWRPAPAEGQYIPAGVPGSNWAAPPVENGTSAPATDEGQAPAASPTTPPAAPSFPAPPSTPPPSTPPPSTPPPSTPPPSTPPPSTPPPATPSPATPPPISTTPAPPPPAMTPPPTEEPRRGRHYPVESTTSETAASESARRARHASDSDPGRPAHAPTLATPAPPPPAPAPGTPTPPPPPEAAAPRHRGAAESADPAESAVVDESDQIDEPAGQHIGGQPLSELMARLQVGSTGGGRRRRRDE